MIVKNSVVVLRVRWQHVPSAHIITILQHNPFTCSYSRSPLPRCYQVHEQEKRRAYNERIRKWRVCFYSLVFAATRSMGPTATTIFQKLVSVLAEKWNMNYSYCLFWVQWQLCFSLLRSSVMCLRGHQSSNSHPMPSRPIFDDY